MFLSVAITYQNTRQTLGS